MVANIEKSVLPEIKKIISC